MALDYYEHVWYVYGNSDGTRHIKTSLCFPWTSFVINFLFLLLIVVLNGLKLVLKNIWASQILLAVTFPRNFRPSHLQDG